MKNLLAASVLFACSCAMGGVLVPRLPYAAESSSGQFVILTSATASFASPIYTDTNLIYLEPSLLPVSCERIKSALYRELGATSAWQGRIYLSPFASDSPLDAVTILSERLPSRWEYRVRLPNPLDRGRYVRAMVEVLLIEMANRTADTRTAEMPEWFVQGLAQQVIEGNPRDVLVPQSRRDGHGAEYRYTSVDAQRTNQLQLAQQRLRETGTLTFDQLSWPTQDELDGGGYGIFPNSAQLFVSRLERLDGGPAGLRTLLATLSVYQNWQVAFLNAFGSHFGRPRDVERWWALQAVDFTGRDALQEWSLDRSRDELAQVLRTPVHVRTDTNDLGLTTVVSLQTIIAEWERDRQVPTLQNAQRKLELLRVRLAPDLIPVADRYCQVLAAYLKEALNPKPAPRSHPDRPTPAAEAAIRELNVLDELRQPGEALPPGPFKVILTGGPSS